MQENNRKAQSAKHNHVVCSQKHTSSSAESAICVLPKWKHHHARYNRRQQTRKPDGWKDKVSLARLRRLHLELEPLSEARKAKEGRHDPALKAHFCQQHTIFQALKRLQP